MGAIEARFADIIWQHEPLRTAEPVKYNEEAFGWKKIATYTVLKRLCDKGIFKSENGCVTSLISKEEFYSVQSEKFIEETSDG